MIDFKYDDNKITSILFKNGKEKKIKDEIIISTLPINLTAKKLGYNSKLQFNSYILCYVIVNTKTEVLPKDTHSIYFAHDNSYFHRVTEQRKYSDEGYPKNKSLLCFEISFRTKPELIKKTPDKLAREVFFAIL